ncbi:hypothetical protein [Bradyrhizobium sp. F1.13.3]|uniref:hypothetical protein n=1 Tax=Bradyrhizobium sp. F1.13.3 TaxID=3156351 RepID=UPI0033972036
MDELHQFSTAMLAVVFAALTLVAGQLYIERASSREHTAGAQVEGISPRLALARSQADRNALKVRVGSE